MEWVKGFYIIGLALAVWLVYQRIRYDRQAFTSISMNKSLRTLGLLALALIGFVGFCILLLKQG